MVDTQQAQSVSVRATRDGIFVNHLANEINLRILLLSARGTRPEQMARYIHAKVPAAGRTEVEDHVFSFLPPGLRALERKRGRPLDESEVLAVRDEAPFVLLAYPRAEALERRRGYEDVHPDRIWESWRERR